MARKAPSLSVGNVTSSNGVEVAQDNTDEVLSAMNRAILRALEDVGLDAEGDVAELAPVDTGRLHDSITHRVLNDELAVIVGSNVEYAAAVEFNEKAHHANGQAHYLRDGINNNLDSYRRKFEEAMKNA